MAQADRVPGVPGPLSLRSPGTVQRRWPRSNSFQRAPITSPVLAAAKIRNLNARAATPSCTRSPAMKLLISELRQRRILQIIAAASGTGRPAVGCLNLVADRPEIGPG
jgi:hypothetical protein